MFLPGHSLSRRSAAKADRPGKSVSACLRGSAAKKIRHLEFTQVSVNETVHLAMVDNQISLFVITGLLTISSQVQRRLQSQNVSVNTDTEYNAVCHTGADTFKTACHLVCNVDFHIGKR